MYNSTEFYTYPAGEQSGRVKGNSRKGGERINRHLSVYPQIINKLWIKREKMCKEIS